MHKITCSISVITAACCWIVKESNGCSRTHRLFWKHIAFLQKVVGILEHRAKRALVKCYWTLLSLGAQQLQQQSVQNARKMYKIRGVEAPSLDSPINCLNKKFPNTKSSIEFFRQTERFMDSDLTLMTTCLGPWAGSFFNDTIEQ